MAKHSLILLALGSAALGGCTQPVEAAATRAIPVKVHTVEAGGGASASRYSGTLEPNVKVDMAFRVSGYVELLGELAARSGGQHRPLDKGDRVTKGSVLARLRQAEYTQKLDTAEAQTNEASAAARLAGEDMERAQRLFAGGAITQAELDTKRARVDSAKAQLAAARARAEEAGLAVRDTLLRAPLDATVLTRSVEVGSLVAAGQPAFTLVDTRSVKAVFGAPEALVAQLPLGSALSVYVGAEREDGSAHGVFAAHVTRIAPAADSLGRVFSVEAELPNENGALRPGAVVSVHVPTVTEQSALRVPLGAVVRSAHDARGFAVFVLDGDGLRAPVKQRDVQLGEVIGNAVSVTSGLANGERVVSVGASLLRDGNDAVVIP